MASTRRWTHLIRFLAKEDGQIHLGQIDAKRFPDVGLATFKGEDVDVKVVSGSIYDGLVTNQVLHVKQVNLYLCHRAQYDASGSMLTRQDSFYRL